jgi:hypothetical protein
MKPVASVALMFLGGSAILGGIYSIAASFLFWKPGLAAALPIALVFAMGVGLLFAGSRFWDRWPLGLAVIFVMLGLGALQTRPGGDDPTHGGAERAFRISGVTLLVAGAASYLIAKRRGS